MLKGRYALKHLVKLCLRSETSVVAQVHWNNQVRTSPCVSPVLCYMGFSGFKRGWIQINVSYTIFLVLFDFNYFLTVLLFEKTLSQLRVLVPPRAAWPFSTEMPFQQPPQVFPSKMKSFGRTSFSVPVWKFAFLNALPLPQILGWLFFTLFQEGTETHGGLQQDVEQCVGAARPCC